MDEIGRKASTETGSWTVGANERVVVCGLVNVTLGNLSERGFR